MYTLNINISGDVLLLQIFNENEDNSKIALKDFQRTIKFSEKFANGNEFMLMGVVNYQGIGGSTRSSITTTSGGHYTAFAYRRGNTSWMRMDDHRDSCEFSKDFIKISPRLLMYVKKPK